MGLVQSAYLNRHLEQPLYTLFGDIAHTICETITLSGELAHTMLTVEEQYRLGDRFSVKGPQPDIKLTSEIPDFVRLLKPCIDDATRMYPKKDEAEDGTVYFLVDMCEIKPLKVVEGVKWDSEDAMKKAEVEIEPSLFQVYSQTMAGFFYNSHWKKVYMKLVVGIYFSHFR